MAPQKPQRLLIFVIAYYAEATLQWVLERIPASIFEDFDCEVLVVDDASEDRTFEIGREYQARHPEIQLTVLRNTLNQGYGGNQKVGYSYAVKEGFDFVAMVHGDGQYAPEELPRLMRPLCEGEAEAVFGSRMMSRFGALRGGMPLYKFVGNKILTRVQNALLGTHFSEFHSGYRIYSIAALKRIRFELNSNDFHFDTEITLQLLNAGQRIRELPIPTYYGDEISRVNGMKYAKDVVLATLRNAAHRSGVLFQRKYDPVDLGGVPEYGLKLGYPSSHQYAVEAVPAGAKVLDIGAGVGAIAAALVEKGCETAVVDQRAPAEGVGAVKVFQQDLDAPLVFDPKDYDYLLMLDVIEHLKDPEQFIERLRARLDHTPRTLVLTTPNVAFVVQRLMLLSGQFNYGKAGILDRTHHRLFTFRTVRHLLRDAGFKIKRVRGVPAPFPKVFGHGALGKAALGINLALIGVSKTVFAYQIYIEAESTPDVDFVLRDAKEKSAFRDQLAKRESRSKADEGGEGKASRRGGSASPGAGPSKPLEAATARKSAPTTKK